MSFEAFPGLRLGATTSRRSWTYRFKSPVDRRMRQQKLGEWPAMSQAAAIAQWQQIRARRDAGEAVLTRKASKRPVLVSTPESYTVRKLCEVFVMGDSERHRDSFGAAQSRRARPDIATELPVSHWAPHDLRRPSRTMLTALGCPHEVAEAILGHVLPGVAGVYSRHRCDSEKREWLTRLATRLEHVLDYCEGEDEKRRLIPPGTQATRGLPP